MVLQRILFALPPLLVCAIGFGLAMHHLRRYPLAAWLTLAGVLLLGLMEFGSILATAAVLHYYSGAGLDSGFRLLSVLGLVGRLGHTCGTLLLLGAIFAGRRSQQYEPPSSPPIPS